MKSSRVERGLVFLALIGIFSDFQSHAASCPQMETPDIECRISIEWKDDVPWLEVVIINNRPVPFVYAELFLPESGKLPEGVIRLWRNGKEIVNKKRARFRSSKRPVQDFERKSVLPGQRLIRRYNIDLSHDTRKGGWYLIQYQTYLLVEKEDQVEPLASNLQIICTRGHKH